MSYLLYCVLIIFAYFSKCYVNGSIMKKRYDIVYIQKGEVTVNYTTYKSISFEYAQLNGKYINITNFPCEYSDEICYNKLNNKIYSWENKKVRSGTFIEVRSLNDKLNNETVDKYIGNNTIKFPNGKFCLYSLESCSNEGLTYTWKYEECNDFTSTSFKKIYIGNVDQWTLKKETPTIGFINILSKQGQRFGIQLLEETHFCNKTLWKTDISNIFVYESDNNTTSFESKNMSKYLKDNEISDQFFSEIFTNDNNDRGEINNKMYVISLFYLIVFFVAFLFFISLWKVLSNWLILINFSTTLSKKEIFIRSFSNILTQQAVFLKKESIESKILTVDKQPVNSNETYDDNLYNNSIYNQY